MCELCLENSGCNCECRGEWKELSEHIPKVEAMIRAQYDKKNTFKCKECKHFVKSAYVNKKKSVPILLKDQGYKCAIHGEGCATNDTNAFFELKGNIPYDIDHKTPVNGDKKSPVTLDEVWIVCLTCHRIKIRRDNKRRLEENKELKSQISEVEIENLHNPMFPDKNYSPSTIKNIERAMNYVKHGTKSGNVYESVYIRYREQYRKLCLRSNDVEELHLSWNEKRNGLDSFGVAQSYSKLLYKHAEKVAQWFIQTEAINKKPE